MIDFQVGGGSYLSANTDGGITINQQTGAISADVFTVKYANTGLFKVAYLGDVHLLASGASLYLQTAAGSGISWSGASTGPVTSTAR